MVNIAENDVVSLDQVDRDILEYLQKDGRSSASFIADKIKMSVPAVADRIKKLQEVDVDSVFWGCKLILPYMHKGGGGSIVNISSTAGIRASISSHYGASKGAVRLLSKSVAVQYAKSGIRCNSVHPGPVETEMGYKAVPESVRAERFAGIPLGRFAQPVEIANAVMFLASDEASFVTGTELIVDGGNTAA